MSEYDVTIQLTLRIGTTQGVVEARGGAEAFSAALREYLMNVDGLLHFVQQHVIRVSGAAVTVEESRRSAQPNAAEGSSPT